MTFLICIMYGYQLIKTLLKTVDMGTQTFIPLNNFSNMPHASISIVAIARITGFVPAAFSFCGNPTPIQQLW